MTRADTAARITEAIKHIALAAQTAEERQAGHRTVRRPVPGRRHRHLGQGREEVPEATPQQRLVRRRLVEHRQHPAAVGKGIATLAEHQPAIAGVVVVMHEYPRIEHADAAGQADLTQQLRLRFGDDHVAGDNRHAAFELRECPRHPGIEGQHHTAGADRATGGFHPGLGPFLQTGHGRAFMDAHAFLQGNPAQATHQLARLYRGGGRREPAFQVPGRARQALYLLHRQTLERVDALALQGGNHAIGGAHLGAVGGGVQGAVQTVVGIDAMGPAKITDGMDALLRGLDQAHRLLHPEQAFEGEILGRPRQGTTAIAPTGPGTTDVGFDQHDVQRRVMFLEHQRGPQAGVATADNAHIAVGVSGQRRTCAGVFLIQRLL
ncbi:hypothetical protein D3C72_1263800 [compost metagenome]